MALNESCKDCEFKHWVEKNDEVIDKLKEDSVKANDFIESGKWWRFVIVSLVIGIVGSVGTGIYAAGKLINQVDNNTIAITTLANTVNQLVWNMSKK